MIFKALKHTVEGGTAARVRIKGLDVYGKTGTAQNPHGEDHGWFLAFAGREGEAPSIALAVFVEFGEGGSSAAGPIARAMLEAYFGLDKPVISETVSSPAVSRPDEDYDELLDMGAENGSL